jgi:hypothetical protein
MAKDTNPINTTNNENHFMDTVYERPCIMQS